jgi:hypothetical protein
MKEDKEKKRENRKARKRETKKAKANERKRDNNTEREKKRMRKEKHKRREKKKKRKEFKRSCTTELLQNSEAIVREIRPFSYVFQQWGALYVQCRRKQYLWRQ